MTGPQDPREYTYRIPAHIHRIELTVVNSRFIATIGPAPTPADARAFIASVREEMPDASHHVFAFRVGYGNSITEGMSDDGEPSGTAGPPALAILRGSDIGDIVVVITRYFGGTKLGTGGLVRAYSEATRVCLSSLETLWKIEREMLGIDTPYPLYEQVKRLIGAHNGMIDDEMFAGDVTIIAIFAVPDIEQFIDELTELSAGRITPVMLGRV